MMTSISSVSLFLDLSWTQSATLLALYLLIVLYLILVSAIVSRRVYLNLFRGHPAHQFSVNAEELTSFDQRLCRAHANLYENAPLWCGVLLLALITHQESVTDSLALYFCLARYMQVITHLTSVSARAVTARFVFFSTQLIILAIWMIKLGDVWFT